MILIYFLIGVRGNNFLFKHNLSSLFSFQLKMLLISKIRARLAMITMIMIMTRLMHSLNSTIGTLVVFI